jgi:hypothetical protein
MTLPPEGVGQVATVQLVQVVQLVVTFIKYY